METMLLFIIINQVLSKINIWEPKNLKNLYLDKDIDFNPMNFGHVPYGHSIYGTVFKATPYDGCTELNPVNWNENYASLIILVTRNNCHFSQKVLNAQKLGASFVLIADNKEENIQQIFPIERSKEILDQIKIPSVLIPLEDASNFLKVIDQNSKENIELAISFDLIQQRKQSELKLILAVDDYRSYDFLTDFYTIYLKFQKSMIFSVHIKMVRKKDSSDETDCLGDKGKFFCVTNLSKVNNKNSNLSLESMRQICIKDYSFPNYIDYLKEVRKSCFNDILVVNDFFECTTKVFSSKLPQNAQKSINDCMTFQSLNSLNLIIKNHEKLKYSIIDYSPLIFLNEYFYKGSYDNYEDILQTFCNSFEKPPTECKNLKDFLVSDNLSFQNLVEFIFSTSFLFIIGIVFLIQIIMTFIKRSMKKNLDERIKTRIDEALKEYNVETTLNEESNEI